LLALILVTCISFGIGQLSWFTFAQTAPIDAQIGGVLIFVLSIGAFLITAHQITNLRWLQLLTFLFIGLGALFLLGWIVSPLGSITEQLFQRSATANSMFWTWLVALAFSQAIFNRKLHVGWRIVLVLIVVMTLYVAYFKAGGWKSGYLPPLVVIATMISVRSWRTGLVIGLLSIGPALYLYTDAVSTDQYSYSTRVEAWLIMLEIIKVNPILGFGPANYHWYTPLFPIRGYAVQFNSHNQYVDIVAQTGILGLACFLWFGVEMAGLGLRLRKSAPEGFAQAYVYGAIGGLAGTFAAAILADWVFPFVYNVGLTGMRGSLIAWVFLGGLISIEQITRRRRQLH
jgi:O-antigen ligase